MKALIYLAVLFFPSVAFGQLPWANILPPGNGIDWNQSGIPGGIPSAAWTQTGSTISASDCADGASDCTSTIQKKLKACGENHFVLLGPGTFLIKKSLSIPSHCALRGSGADKT